MTSTVVGTDFTGGARLPNYVNGRRLTAEDLATSQSTLRARDALIGRAAGQGVVDGLWVTSTATTLSVTAGLAVSAAGHPIRLSSPKTLPLTSVVTAGSTSPGTFACCGSGADGTDSAIGTGSYLLTVRPACESQGQAPLAEAPDQSTSAGCGAQWQVDGVRFTAIELPEIDEVDGQSMSLAWRRNLLAHWCFGVDQLTKLGVDPFAFAPDYAGLDTLDTAELTDCDVPLAVFHWDGQQVADLDNWSVRRRVTAPDPVTASWSAVLGDRRASDGQARFLQFQDQLAAAMSRGGPPNSYVGEVFGLLPPVGFVPVVRATMKRVIDDVSDDATIEATKQWLEESKASRVVSRGLFTAAGDYAPPPSPAAPAPETPPEAAPNGGDGGAEALDLHLVEDGTRRVELYERPSTKFTILDTLTDGMLDTIHEISRVIDMTPDGGGYDPDEFFGGLAQFGGVITWEEADLLLQQSWHRDPVVVPEQPLSSEGDTATADATEILVAKENGRAILGPHHRATALTYYFVYENLRQFANVDALVWRREYSYGRRRNRFFGGGAFYVVFAKNYLVLERTEAPVVRPVVRGQVIQE